MAGVLARNENEKSASNNTTVGIAKATDSRLKSIEINVLSDVKFRRSGREVSLIASKKTRALMAYLSITNRAHSREHLCEMFFDSVSDPRGGLRWSLSKIRNLFNDDSRERLVAKEDTVQLDLSDVFCDANFVKQVELTPNPSLDRLRKAADYLLHRPLANLELPRSEEYQMWLLDTREDFNELRVSIFQKLVGNDNLDDMDSLKYLRSWWRLDPYSHIAPYLIWKRLQVAGRAVEAKIIRSRYETLMGEDSEDWLEKQSAESTKSKIKRDGFSQTVRFCKTADGAKLAYATSGSGPSVILTPGWLSHLELEWSNKLYRDTFDTLSMNKTLVRYDECGTGMSDRSVGEVDFLMFQKSFEAVVADHSASTFAVIGVSKGCSVAIDFAARNPERVSALILVGGFASGWKVGMSNDERQYHDAMLALSRLTWDKEGGLFRDLVSRTLMPTVGIQTHQWFQDLQKYAVDEQSVSRMLNVYGEIDVRDKLKKIKAPTLVIHSRNDQAVSIEHSKEIAACIPNARLFSLESRNHIILSNDPAWQVYMEEIDHFLQEND